MPIMLQITSLSQQADAPSRSVYTITDILDPYECALIISTHTNLIPSNVTPETVRDRVVFDDEKLADLVWGRLRSFFVSSEEESKGGEMIEGRVVDEDGHEWKIKGLNERWRLCRYDPGK